MDRAAIEKLRREQTTIKKTWKNGNIDNAYHKISC